MSQNYILYDMDGRIIGTGGCQNKMVQAQARGWPEGTKVIEGYADSKKHKVIDGKIVDKTTAEIKADAQQEPKPIPFEDQPAHITREQWQSILERLDKLEKNNVKNKN